MKFLHINISPIAFYIPVINFPVRFYSLCFFVGFLGGYFFVKKFLKNFFAKIKGANSGIDVLCSKFKVQNIDTNDRYDVLIKAICDNLLFYLMMGTVVGARCGEFFFYQWDTLLHRPWEIFQIWNGGLSSHGGVIGILLAIFMYHKIYMKYLMPFLQFLDTLVVPIAFCCGMIRIGNVFNQEVLGKASDVPWAVVFENPFDRSIVVPRHPVQIYESLTYFSFAILFFFWQKRDCSRYFFGYFLFLMFSARFVLEFFKMGEGVMNLPILQGQLLSIPFIFLGIFLMTLKKKCKKFLHQ